MKPVVDGNISIRKGISFQLKFIVMRTHASFNAVDFRMLALASTPCHVYQAVSLVEESIAQQGDIYMPNTIRE